MIRWVLHKLAPVLPPVIDAESTRMRFSTTQRRLFLKETRFLFFSQNGPVELALRPGHILAGISGGAGLAALVLLSPGLSSVTPLSGFASLLPDASVIRQQESAVLPPAEAEQKQIIQTASGVSLSFLNRLISVLSEEQTAHPPGVSRPQTGGGTAVISAETTNAPPLPPDTALAVRAPTNFTTIEEPNDELITEPAAPQTDAALQVASAQVSIAVPAARPAPEPMDPEFVAFDGLGIPPLQTDEVRLTRRFANALAETARIEEMMSVLGITPEGAPEPWDNTLNPAETLFPALYMYRDSWREILDTIPLKAPLRYYYVTSPYGMRTNKKTGVTRFHHGVDLAGTWKARLRPSASGVVTFAGRDGGFGNVVRVEHAHGIETVYAHLSSVAVSKGSFVTPQDVLGTMGNTGHSDGMHLHYEIRIDGQSVDPEDFFAFGHRLTVTGRLDSDW